MTIEEHIQELEKQLTQLRVIAGVEKDIAELKAKSKEREFKYPMYFKNTKNDVVVKFSNLNTGVVAVSTMKDYRVGYSSDNFFPHTDTSWEQVNPLDVIPDKALVWGQDNHHPFYQELRFWDAKNKRTFHREYGNRTGSPFDNYEIYTSEEPKWAIEARKMLED
jgi:hypothetical protein